MSEQYYDTVTSIDSNGYSAFQQPYVRPRINRRESDGGSPDSSQVDSHSYGESCLDRAEQAYSGGNKPSAAKESRAKKPNDLRFGVASPVMPGVPTNFHKEPKTELRAEPSATPVAMPPGTASLVELSESTREGLSGKMRLSGPFFFADLDEFAFDYFVHWLNGSSLHGPHDFHSMNHYLCLYVLAGRFKVESLKNRVMDLVRAYYHREVMTAPAFRLDYIYANTEKPNLMRKFLVMTAAYRALVDNDQEDSSWKGISDSIKGVLSRGSDVAPDFAEALIMLVCNDREDVRKGDPCRWHEHTITPVCPAAPLLEPYETT